MSLGMRPAFNMLRAVVTLHSLTTYEIRVPGRLDASWADYVGANAITHTNDAEEGLLTVVTLWNADQSALIGMINMLFDSGVPLVGVRHIRVSGKTCE